MSTKNSTSFGSRRAIAASAGIIGLATLCSRLLGFLRDMVIARVFGVYLYAQAFVIAFRIPNLFRDLLGEGASNAAFVPVFSEYRVKHTREEFWELANVVLNLLLVLLISLGIIFSPLLVRLIAPGFMVSPEKLQATITLNRIIFPYILLISLAAYSMGILNSLQHFAVPAFAPCLLNISLIVFALLFGEGIKGLALGVLVGGVLQLTIQIPVLYKKGFRLRLFRRFKHPAAKTIGRLMVPRVLSSSIYQLNNFVDSIFGSLSVIVGEGGVAVLYFAYRLIQFPLGVFSTSLSQAILPALSAQSAQGQLDKLKETFSFGLRATFFVMLPASVALMVLAQPIISGLFGGGKFDLYAVNTTAAALMFYSLGLSAYAVTKVTQSCFFALQDTLTPAKNSALNLFLDIVFNLALIFSLKLAGIALATSLSGIISCLVLIARLRRRLEPFDSRPLVLSFLKIACASLCMGAACYFARRYIFIPGPGVASRLANLVYLVAVGLVSYIIFALLFRLREMRELRDWLFKKRNRSSM
jgi:putative peptidoglycan lipid II flippase